MTDAYETLKKVKDFDFDKAHGCKNFDEDGQSLDDMYMTEMFAINEDAKGDVAVIMGNAYKLGYMRAKGLI